MTTETENLQQVYNPNTANKKEENRKIAFIQAAFVTFKEALKKLVQDEFLRQKMIEEWTVAAKDARAQSSQEAWDKLFQTMLAQIQKQLKAYWANKLSPMLPKIIAEQLNNVLQQIYNISILKTQFKEEEKIITSRIDAVDTGLLRIETSLAAPVAPAPAALTALAEEVTEYRNEVSDLRGFVDGWLNKLNEPTHSLETSMRELSASRSRIHHTDLQDLLDAMLGKENISQIVNVDKEREALFKHSKTLDTFDLRIDSIQQKIQTQAAQYPWLATNPNIFLKTSKRLEKDEFLKDTAYSVTFNK